MKKKRIVIALGHEALGSTLPEQQKAAARPFNCKFWRLYICRIEKLVFKTVSCKSVPLISAKGARSTQSNLILKRVQ